MRVEKKELIQSVIRGIAYFPKVEEDKKETQEELIKDWFEGTVHLLSELENRKFGKLIEDNYVTPGESQDYLEIFRWISKPEYEKYYKYFRPSDVFKERLIPYLADMCNRGSFSTVFGQSAKLISLYYYKEFQWKPLLDSLQKILMADSHHNVDEARGCLILLTELGLRNHLGILNGMVKSGHIAHLLSRPDIQGDEQSAGLCVFLFFVLLPDAKLVAHEGDSSKGAEFYLEFCKRPNDQQLVLDAFIDNVSQEYQRINRIEEQEGNILVRRLGNEKVARLAAETIEKLFYKNVGISEIISADELIEHYRLLKGKLSGDAFEKIIKHYVESSVVISVLLDGPYDTQKKMIYNDIIEAKKHRKNSNFIKYVARGLAEEDIDVWYKNIINNEIAVYLLMKLRKMRIKIRPRNLKNALKKIAIEIIGGQIAISNEAVSDLIEKLLEMLDQKEKNDLSSSVIEAMIENPDVNYINMLSLFGRVLAGAHYRPMDIRNIIDHIICPIIRKKYDQEIEWMEKLIKNRSVINQDPVLKQSFKNMINELEDSIRVVEEGTKKQIMNAAKEKVEKIIREIEEEKRENEREIKK